VATSFRSALRSLAGQPLSVDELATRMCEQHWEEGIEARRRYVTAIFLQLQPDKAEIKVVNAGHNPAALLLPDGRVYMIEASGTPLGMLPGIRYDAETFDFPQGARILLYTDGMTEVFREEEEFGSDRLIAAFCESPASDAGTILDRIWGRLTEFSSNAAQTDDMTALAICHLYSPHQEFATT
jgi:serine phosphatase RsbU (regulator of sigma subunit)